MCVMIIREAEVEAAMSDILEFFRHVNQLSPMPVYLAEAKSGDQHGILDCQVELGPVTRTPYTHEPATKELDEYSTEPQQAYPTLRTSVEVNQYALGDILYAHQIADALVERWNSHTREIDEATKAPSRRGGGGL